MKTYQCANCGQECGGNNNADKEAELYWGVKNAVEKAGSEMVVICNDCWENQFHPLDHLDKYQQARTRILRHTE